MVVNLLPCMALQKGTMLLAVIDAMISIINVGTLVIGFLIFDKDDPDFSDGEKIITLVVLIVVTIVCILQIALAFKLYMAAINKNYKSCRLWMIISAVVLIINVLNTTVDTATTDFEGTSLAGNVIAIIYKIYEMIVVYAFLQELKSNEGLALKTSLQLGSGSPVFTTDVESLPPQQSYPMQTFNYQAPGQTMATAQLGPMVVTAA